MNTQEEKEEVLGGFDPHIVHHRDPLTKRVTKVNAYRMIVSKGTRYFEWPKSSGNLWYEDRRHAGVLTESGEPVIGKEHKEWIPPVSEDDQLGIRAASLEQENKKLQAELTAIKKEAEANKAIAKDAASKAMLKTVESEKVQAAKPQAKPEVKAATKK